MQDKGRGWAVGSDSGTLWLVWPQHLPFFLHSSSYLFFCFSFHSSCLCPSAHVKHPAPLWCGPPRELDLCSSFSTFLHPQGVLLHRITDIPEDELHSLRFPQRPLDYGFAWLFHTREMRAGATWGAGWGEVPDPCLAFTSCISAWLWGLNTYNKQIFWALEIPRGCSRELDYTWSIQTLLKE